MLPAQVPFATWRPVANFTPGAVAGYGLVLHVQVGTGSPQGWFADPTSQASSHFWVGVDGKLEQYVATDATAWAQMAGNGLYWSVETEGVPTEPLTAAQVSTLARLLAYLHTEAGVPLEWCDHGGRGLTTHAHYPSGIADPAYGDHPCPGPLRSAQVPAIVLAARALVAPQQTELPVPTEGTSHMVIVQAISDFSEDKALGLVAVSKDACYVFPPAVWIPSAADLDAWKARLGEPVPLSGRGVSHLLRG